MLQDHPRAVLSLASALAHADGRVSDEEFSFLFHYATRLSTGFESQQAMDEITGSTAEQSRVRLEESLVFMAGEAYSSRILYLLRGLDFAAADGISPPEWDLLQTIADRLEVAGADLRLARWVVDPEGPRPPSTAGTFQAIVMGHCDAGGLPMGASARLVLVNLDGRRFVRAEALGDVPMAGESPIPAGTLTQLREPVRLTLHPHVFGAEQLDILIGASQHAWEPGNALTHPGASGLAPHATLWVRGPLVAVEPTTSEVRVNGRRLEIAVRRVLLPSDRITAGGKAVPLRFEGWADGAPQANGDASLDEPEVTELHTGLLRGSQVTDVMDRLTGLHLKDLEVTAGGATLVDKVSLEVDRGELVCVLGPSGCGKTTLLEALCGRRPIAGGVAAARVGWRYVPVSSVSERLSMVPQDGVLLPQLTVRENIALACRLRLPLLGRAGVARLTGECIEQVGLSARADMIVGSPDRRLLSGGQRKRVSIAMELVGKPEVLLLDEPLSGLSSYDARSQMVLFHDLARRGRIVMVVVHQPSAELFAYFDKVVVMDRGGKLAFVGPPQAAIAHFAAHGRGTAAAEGGHPDVILATMEQQRSGAVDGERAFPPHYWHALFTLRHPNAGPPERELGAAPERATRPMTARLVQLMTVFKRHFLIRIRNRSALALSFFLAPFLGLLLGFVLKQSAEGAEYSFGANANIAHFVFLAPVVTFFLGMTGACTEFLIERRLITHERALGVPTHYFLASKVGVLLAWGALETFLFVSVAGAILEMSGAVGSYYDMCLLAAYVGMGVGLLVSTVAPNLRVAFSCVPLALIPQLLFGGSIPYDQMNPAVYGSKTANHADAPAIGQLMPVRWAYEGLIVALATRDHWTLTGREKELDALKQEERDLVPQVMDGAISRDQFADRKAAIFEERKALMAERDRLRNAEAVRLVDLAAKKAEANPGKNAFLAPERRLFGHAFAAPDASYLVLAAQLMLALLGCAAALRFRR